MSKQFGPSFPGHYPSEMRTQMWPLCCGAAIISGFKAVQNLTTEELDAQVADVMSTIPDSQIFKNEAMRPQLTFLTLNEAQTNSPKIMDAVKKAGFIKFAEGRPRGGKQTFFLRDSGGTFTLSPTYQADAKTAGKVVEAA